MRIEFIDGLRGFAALCIIYFHYSALYYPTMWEGIYNHGRLADIFFVISGFILSYKFWQRGTIEPLTISALRRYIRLTASPFVSILLGYLLTKFGLVFVAEVCEITTPLEFMKVLFRVEPNFFSAIYEGLFGIYFNYVQHLSYNPVLWTMEVDFKGSILTLAFLALFGKIKNRWALYIIFSVISILTNVWYLAFVAGIALSDLMYSDECQKYREIFFEKKFCAWILMIGSWLLATYALNVGVTVYEDLNFAAFNYVAYNAEIFYHTIAAIMMVYSIAQLKFFRQIFSWRFFTMLGKYSFAIYLIHIPIMISFSSYVFLVFWHHGAGLAVSIFFASVLGILVTAIAVVLMYNFVDVPAGNLAKRVQKFFS